jgi:hypothetical protein
VNDFGAAKQTGGESGERGHHDDILPDFLAEDFAFQFFDGEHGFLFLHGLK